MDFYHVMNRGVAKLPIVYTDKDRLRFVTNLLVMNDAIPIENLSHSLGNSVIDFGNRYERVGRKRLVTIHAWCLMGNHYHMLVSPNAEAGMTTFLRKLNIGYANYFNKKHNRSGALFQGKTKRVLIENDRQFLYILPYIHLNPLDFMKSGASWRVQSLANHKAALKWVTDYRWSSYRNYAGETEFTEILEGSELSADRKSHTKELERFLIAMPEPMLTKLNLE